MPDPQVSTRDDRHVYGWMIIGMSLVIAALAVVVRTSDLPVAKPASVSTSRAATTTALLVRGTIAAQVGKAGEVDIAIGITNPGGTEVTAAEAAVKITPALDTPAIHFTTGLPTQALKGGADGPDSIAIAGYGTGVLVTEFHLNCEQVRAGQTQTLSVTVQALGSDGITQAIDLTPDQFSLNALVWKPACR